MPDQARTIIVSGGIEAVAPFTVGCIPMVVNVSPDVVSDSIMCQGGVAPNQFITIGSAPSDATTEILQTEGAIYPSGGLTDSLAIGRGASVVGAVGGQLAIGYGATIDAGGSVNNFNNLLVGGANTADDNGLIGMANNVLVGFSNSLRDQASACVLIGLGHVADGTDSNQVRIGNTSTMSSVNLANVVGIGNGITIGFRGVAIGDRASASGGDAISIGQEAPVASGPQSIAIGRAVRARSTDGICIGALANNLNTTDKSSIALGINAQTFKANQMVVGGIGTAAISEVLIGAGNSPNQSPPFADLTIRTSNIPSAGVPDLSGASITIKTGTGIGATTGGEFIVEVPITVASGTGVQPAVTGLQVQESSTATETFLLIRDVDNGALERVSVGAADSGGLGFKVLRIPN
ncbi:MAG: hypothetical protein GY906_22815 [bacterium]|nr:hypothetical protein [bacterium]